MIIRSIAPTPALTAWLQRQHDDGQPALTVAAVGDGLEVLRADGAELSETEAAHVRGIIAAHRVQPLFPPPSKGR